MQQLTAAILKETYVLDSNEKNEKKKKKEKRKSQEHEGNVDRSKWKLMEKVQIGITHSAGKHAVQSDELSAADFDPKHKKVWTRFHSDGFKWKDYCPVAFTYFRHLFGLENSGDYVRSVHALVPSSYSPGKSGSFFFLTRDQRFVIKTLDKSDLNVLLRMLPTYYRHVSRYKNTLLTKFFGLHCVKPVRGPKTRFVVMGNIFNSAHRIHRRYDIKGSSHGRTISGKVDEATTLKDLDLDFVFRLETPWFQQLIWQIERDCEFLEAERIMDYSLLIGVHFRSNNSDDGDKLTHSSGTTTKRSTLGTNLGGKAERVSKSVEITNTDIAMGGDDDSIFDVALNVGIIDILQDYDITKKVEHVYKSLQLQSTSISAVHPKLYSKRFRDSIHTIFLQQN